MTTQLYDVVIVGGGVAGAALLYSVAKFTDLKRCRIVLSSWGKSWEGYGCSPCNRAHDLGEHMNAPCNFKLII